MAFILRKPYSLNERIDFINEYNRKLGLSIQETDEALWALKPDERIIDGKPAKNTDYEKEIAIKKKKQIALLSITKLDFLKYVCKPNGITYSKLMDIINSDENLKEVWELCERIYRGDEFLNKYIVKYLPDLSQEALDKIFEEVNNGIYG